MSARPQYGVCFRLFDTPGAAAHAAVKLLPAELLTSGALVIFETSTTMPLQDYLELCAPSPNPNPQGATHAKKMD